MVLAICLQGLSTRGSWGAEEGAQAHRVGPPAMLESSDEDDGGNAKKNQQSLPITTRAQGIQRSAAKTQSIGGSVVNRSRMLLRGRLLADGVLCGPKSSKGKQVPEAQAAYLARIYNFYAEKFWLDNPLAILGRSLQLCSGCTGVFAEGYVFKGCNVPINKGVCMSDKKPDSFDWCRSAWSNHIGCFHGSLGDAVQSKACKLHKGAHRGRCALPERGSTDISLCCGPCQAFSSQRRDDGLAEDHPLHAVTMEDLVDGNSLIPWIRRVLPKVLVSEQVAAFKKTRKEGIYKDKTPLKVFLERVQGIVGLDGKQWFTGVCVVNSCPSPWLDARRPRWHTLNAVSFEENKRNTARSKRVDSVSHIFFAKAVVHGVLQRAHRWQ